MRIIFVRHGNPNYEHDCLTELGHVQAAAVAERLVGEGIERIFSSTCGRAMETAEYTAKRLGLEVAPCDFIREINWGMKDGTRPYSDGNPWKRATEFIKSDRSGADPLWRDDSLFAETKTPESLDALGKGLDLWLASLGYTREGKCYRVKNAKHRTVAIFCHGGAFAAAFSHIFSIPMPFALACVPFAQTGISEIEISGGDGELAIPRLFNGHATSHLSEKGIKIT